MVIGNDIKDSSDSRLLHSLRLTNFLSFGEQGIDVSLPSLTLIIGPNGSGKSNFIEAIDLLRSTPRELYKPIREGGGVKDWLWKGGEKRTPVAMVDAVLSNPSGLQNLRHSFSFTAINQRFELVDESIENEVAHDGDNVPYFYYRFNKGHPVLNARSEERSLQREDVDIDSSILSQRRDPEQYPEITYLARALEKVRVYREWQFGRHTPARLPQKADLPNDYLAEDASNLGLVLNHLRRDPRVKKRLIEALRELYDGIDDYEVLIEGGTVQVFFQEGNSIIPATRLSDGTLRYLCLLAILCHPKPPPLVCIEEPELGLHPDIMPSLAELLKEAANRCQLVVTTHSDELVDAMTDQPESLLVCERGKQGTTLTRLDIEDLKPWLEKYRLGDLWTRGEIGGMRW